MRVCGGGSSGSGVVKRELIRQYRVVVGEQVKTHYSKLNACLQKWDTPFFAGAKPAGGDFHMFEMIDQHEAMVRIRLTLFSATQAAR
jgi:hypothetical protein